MKKVFALFNMFAAYICVIISMVSVTYYVIFANMFANAFIMSLAGFSMFMIARTLHHEYRQGKL